MRVVSRKLHYCRSTETEGASFPVFGGEEGLKRMKFLQAIHLQRHKSSVLEAFFDTLPE